MKKIILLLTFFLLLHSINSKNKKGKKDNSKDYWFFEKIKKIFFDLFNYSIEIDSFTKEKNFTLYSFNVSLTLGETINSTVGSEPLKKFTIKNGNFISSLNTEIGKVFYWALHLIGFGFKPLDAVLAIIKLMAITIGDGEIEIRHKDNKIEIIIHIFRYIKNIEIKRSAKILITYNSIYQKIKSTTFKFTNYLSEKMYDFKDFLNETKLSFFK